jgi:hypothetical protein
MKECIKCNKKQNYNEFYKSTKHKDGYFNICKKCNKQKYLSCRKEKIEYQKKYKENNLEKISSYNKEWRKKNKEYFQEYYKEWREKNKEKINEYNKKQYKENIQYKLKNILRSRFYSILKKDKKETSILNLIGCSISNLKSHIEKQFLPEMNWDNHGKVWEIDHIKPCIIFDLTDPKQQQECFHFTNLQPLFKTTEISIHYGYENQKGNRNKPKKQ